MSPLGRLVLFLNVAVWHGVAVIGVMRHEVLVSMLGTGFTLFCARWLHDLSDDEEGLEGDDGDDENGDAAAA